MASVSGLLPTPQDRAGPIAAAVGLDATVSETTDTDTESESDDDSVSDSSSSKSIPNDVPNRQDASAATSVETALSSTARPVFKMKRTGRPGHLQPSSLLGGTTPGRSQLLSLNSLSSSDQEPEDVTGRPNDDEPEPPMIKSDISLQATAPVVPHNGQDRLDYRHNHLLTSTVGTPKAVLDPAEEAERKRKRRERLSIEMKERWASGLMDHVHTKRMETLKRRREGPNPLGTGERTPKRRADESSVRDVSPLSKPASVKLSQAPRPNLTSGVTKHSDPSPREPRHPLNLTEGNFNELWEYIRPRLAMYKGHDVPTLGWVDKLIHLPRVRDLHWNTPFTNTHPFRDYKPRDISAMIMHVTGEEAPRPCTKCEEGNGPFKGCVMLSRDVSGVVAKALSSCANCTYHYGARYCSHSPQFTEKSTPGSTANNTRPGNPAVGDQVSSNGDADIEDEDSLAGNATSRVARSGKEHRWGGPSTDDANAKTVTPVAIETAPSGRPYSKWFDESDTLLPLYGALLPDGYELDKSIPGRPWVCPVDTCQRLFLNRSVFGFHFSRIHYACTLNDNGDGTFTITGQYDEKQIGKGGGFISKTPSLPLVTSANARTKASENQILQPRLPKYLERDSLSYPQADPTPSAKDESDLDSQGDGLSPRRRSQRLIFNVRRSEDGKGIASLSRGSDGDELSNSAVSHLRSHPPPRRLVNGVGDSTGTRARSQFDRTVISTSLISAGQVLPTADALEMEEWEIAPGRIRAGDFDTPDNIALSKAYLTSSESVQICSGLAFRVDVIRSGATLRLEPAAEVTRVCSIASGKLRIRIDGEPEFAIGPHGLFKVRPGTACSVQNRLYIDAIVHISSLTE